MQEPSPHRSRIILAGALTASIALGGAGFLIGRGTSERAPVAVAPPVAAPSPAPEPATSGVLGRADLIALTALASDAAAAGRDPDGALREAEGRRFEVRLPFGCSGPADADSSAAMRWSYDADDSALRVSVAPAAWTAADWWGNSAPAGIDAIEGFWITRPWTSSEACPVGDDRPVAAGVEPVTLPGQTLALGRILSEAREDRREGRAYETVVRVTADELDMADGLRLRISGRIARVSDAGPIQCRQPAGPEQRPICLIGVVMDEIAIENPASDETIATWSTSERGAFAG